MKTALYTLLMTAALLAPVLAHADGARGEDGTSGPAAPSELYLSRPDPALTPQEKAGLAIAQRWQRASATGMKPVAGPDGAIRYVFGAQQPSIVCAVLQVCDIELQTGEQVKSLHLGDAARWLAEPGITGTGPGAVPHIILKPLDTGLETSMVVTTNKRTYHLRLRSHRSHYMPSVSFIYPEEQQAKWDAFRLQESQDREQRTLPSTGEYLGELSFAYDIAGAAPWKPVRVYNDGRKTLIQMPRAMAQTEAPALLVVRKEGGLFTDEETAMVNYRVQGDRYIVDALFDKAILISGVGGGQDRVTLTRRP